MITDVGKTTYAKLLQDPRWQKKRLKIMERDGWKCIICKGENDTLHVHHRYYKSSEGPWDYPDRALVTLCRQCHDLYGHGTLSGVDYLISEILGSGAFYAELNELADAFSTARELKPSDFSAIARFIKFYAKRPDQRDFANGAVLIEFDTEKTDGQN